MKKLIALLLLVATPAFAANDGEVTILRGTPAPPQPWYQPPPAPQEAAPDVVYPQLFYYPVRVRRTTHRGFPRFRR